MSDALDYLMKVRPEAMQSYFAFIRAAGTHLDRRTRALISVITKVDRQTEAGFRQYVTRALQEGITADEILDAMLVAFPTLGLSKIIWAVDMLLAMDIPEFRSDRLGAVPESWHDIAAEADVAGRRVSRIAADGRELFVFNSGEIRVYDSRCPHQSTNIPGDAAAGDVLTCPRHGWQFNLETGQCIARGDRPLQRLEHRLEEGRLLVRW